MKAALPPASSPLFDASGVINPAWYMALTAILNRTGGTAQDYVLQSLKTTQTGIVVALDPPNGGATTRSLVAGTGLSVTNGSGVAGNPTAILADTTVTPGSFGDSTHVSALTVDQQGRLTACASTAIAFPVTSVFGRTGAIVASATDLTDFEAEANWTPTDASGGGVTFSSVTAQKWALAGFGIASFDMTFSTTASGATVKIGGLPHNVVARIVLPARETTSAIQGIQVMAIPTQPQFELYKDAGPQLVNSDLSGKRIIGAVAYFY